MAGLGGLWAERAGVINIGLEGMMIVGTWTAAWFGYLHGPLVGFIAAAIYSVLASGFFHAILDSSRLVLIRLFQDLQSTSSQLVVRDTFQVSYFPPKSVETEQFLLPSDSFPTFTSSSNCTDT
jgi:hypothetical protein